jgi:hypothetical protein
MEDVRRELKRFDLDMVNVSWNDAGRAKNSSVGMQIADVQLVALTQSEDGQYQTFPQPVVRPGNFKDITTDIDLEKVMIPVGNAWGAPLFAVPLKLILQNPSAFLSWNERIGSLLSPRDSKVLVAAQASLMPVPAGGGQAHFVPTIRNYSSTPDHPATLVILVSNNGTSITVNNNRREDQVGRDSRGQLLYHNEKGTRHPFLLEAKSAVEQTAKGRKRLEDLAKSGQAIANQNDVNQVLMIQIPLKVPRNTYRGGYALESLGLESFGPSSSGMRRRSMTRSASLDTGVVGVSKVELGKFEELYGNETLERDSDFPIRIDVIRYFAASSTDIDVDLLKNIPEQLEGIYSQGDNIGSLVTGSDVQRVTRNYRPWNTNWWPALVQYLPRNWKTNPERFFEKELGPDWRYYLCNPVLAERTLKALARTGN